MVQGAGRERLFLYGTLRRGGSRDVLKYYGDVEFVGTARVRGVLYDLGEYPGLQLSEAADWVRGELFDVTTATLAQLDEWEGVTPSHPGAGEYRRVRIGACREGGALEPCWVYEIERAKCDGRPVIASGDWLAGGRLS